ncbi:hypothetical protein BEP19_06560 [Ammoniphilus oxalaticus]|uniref:Uncharacterized protein n=1 Tax=Ammoniphilus oxalaticus TaxID=66863 RepID=A0A419SJE5_9BACL|nr:hypothetical protein [Ammoniphilus oxalaticus]RKD24066.1 hypothetical protein BEP19_06560 [Ammoniphilus oxalaticus]
MNTYEEIEYTNVNLQLDHESIHRLIERLVDAGLPVAWKETQRKFKLSIQTTATTQQLMFEKQGKIYKLRNKSYNIKDQRFSEVLQKFIYEVKGHAVLKKVSAGQLVVHNIRYGEPIRITEIKGQNKKVLFEKECSVSINEVIEAFRRNDAEKRIPLLMKEIDQHLSHLYEAMQNNQEDRAREIKEELEKKRIEMLMLEV